MWQHAAPASGVAAARRDAFHLTDVFQVRVYYDRT